MTVKTNCRHYVLRSTSGGDRIEQCKLSANEVNPFACPVGCLFFEARKVAEHGWQVQDRTPDD
jgi:hypothetical protein